ncbi:MAG: hypothetical protein VX899_04785 [Myxococcota bacterium]|nr:hypothetical protein [Myxococcota bacterium]
MSLLALATFTACSTPLQERAQFLTGPEAFVWSDDRFEVQGEDEMRGSVSLSDGELSVYFFGFPPGTELLVGDTTVSADAEGRMKADVSAFAYFNSIKLPAPNESSWNTGTLGGLTLQVTPPGGQAFSVPVPDQTVYFPGEDLVEAAKRGPVLFHGETNADPEQIKAIYYDNGYDEVVLGMAQTIGELDALAFVQRVTVKEITCDGYVDEAGNPTSPVILQVQDAKVQVFGRRSGKVLAEKTFPSKNEDCPSSVYSFDSSQQKRSSHMPREEMQAWVKAQVSG